MPINTPLFLAVAACLSWQAAIELNLDHRHGDSSPADRLSREGLRTHVQSSSACGIGAGGFRGRDRHAVRSCGAAGGNVFCYWYYTCPDPNKLIPMACANGLHAMSSETGKDVWWLRQRGVEGVTPRVDQANG